MVVAFINDTLPKAYVMNVISTNKEDRHFKAASTCIMQRWTGIGIIFTMDHSRHPQHVVTVCPGIYCLGLPLVMLYFATSLTGSTVLRHLFCPFTLWVTCVANVAAGALATGRLETRIRMTFVSRRHLHPYYSKSVRCMQSSPHEGSTWGIMVVWISRRETSP